MAHKTKWLVFVLYAFVRNARNLEVKETTTSQSHRFWIVRHFINKSNNFIHNYSFFLRAAFKLDFFQKGSLKSKDFILYRLFYFYSFFCVTLCYPDASCIRLVTQANLQLMHVQSIQIGLLLIQVCACGEHEILVILWITRLKG